MRNENGFEIIAEQRAVNAAPTLRRPVCSIACGDTVTDAHLSNPEILARAADWLPPLTAGERT